MKKEPINQHKRMAMGKEISQKNPKGSPLKMKAGGMASKPCACGGMPAKKGGKARG